VKKRKQLKCKFAHGQEVKVKIFGIVGIIIGVFVGKSMILQYEVQWLHSGDFKTKYFHESEIELNGNPIGLGIVVSL